MANLSENPQWVDGIYQIETSDPVVGGPDGVSNRQAKELASRTRYLKKEQEKTGSDLATHAVAADPHTQYAPKANPIFTGTPKAPTPATDSNSQQVATTAFVKSVVAALINDAPTALDTLQELAKSLGNDPNFSTTVLNAIADVKSEAANKLNAHTAAADPHTQYAPKASPALTGKPTAPTAVQASNDTQVATTAFVKAAVAALVNGSPAALDTLQELANALGNDPNFSTTVLNAISDVKASASSAAAIAASANTNANGRVPSGRKVNGKPLADDVTLAAGDVGAYTKAETDTKVSAAMTVANNAVIAATNANTNANGRVPSGRKVNGKALTADIALVAADIGALPVAGTATAAAKLATPRKINGVAFDGSADITLTPVNLGFGEFNLAPAALLQFSSHLLQRLNFKVISNDTLEVSLEIKSHGRFVEINKTRLFILDDNATIISGKGTSRFNPVGKFIVTSITFPAGNNNLATVKIYYQNHGLTIGGSKVFRVAGFIYREIGCSWMGHVSTSGASYNSYYMTLNKPISVPNAPIISSSSSSHYDFDDTLGSVTVGADNQPTSISAAMLGKDIVSFSVADTDIISPRDTDMATIIVYDIV